MNADSGSEKAAGLPGQPFAGMLASTLATERDQAEALPGLIAEAGDDDLRRSLEGHLAETVGHEIKVRRMFEAFGTAPAPAERNPALAGLAEMHQERITSTPPELRDLEVAAAAAAAEHLEISQYEALRTMADAIDRDDVVALIDEILAEERRALDIATMAVHRFSRGHTDEMGPRREE